ncbi:MAG: hypothetical protein WCP21_08960 [Armatimonadota bacterium]
MKSGEPRSWKLRAVIFVLGLVSTGGSALLQETMLRRVLFLVAAGIWAIALGLLVKERLGRKGEG